MNIKYILFSILAVSSFSLFASRISVHTSGLSLILDADKGKSVKYVYFGHRLNEHDLDVIPVSSNGRMDAYPAYGMNTPYESALSVRHADGNLSTELVVEGQDVADESDATITTIHLKDKVYPLYVDLKYRAYKEVDMIEAWTEIANKEKGMVVLTNFASMMLPIRRGNVYATHFYGSWANEAQVVEERLNPGQLVVANHEGIRNSHTDHAEMMFSLDGKAHEESGDVIAAALCYSGNYKLKTVTDETDYHYFFAGIDSDNSDYHLKRGETFRTPSVAFTFSQQGMGGASRNFHKWGRKYVLAHGNEVRPVLLNSWEGVYFKINQDGMAQMMKDIADMGGELFVMDDGWFGDKYPRNSDKTSLGDWMVDKRKLPDGIDGLLRSAKDNGIKFGIWI